MTKYTYRKTKKRYNKKTKKKKQNISQNRSHRKEVVNEKEKLSKTYNNITTKITKYVYNVLQSWQKRLKYPSKEKIIVKYHKNTSKLRH